MRRNDMGVVLKIAPYLLFSQFSQALSSKCRRCTTEKFFLNIPVYQEYKEITMKGSIKKILFLFVVSLLIVLVGVTPALSQTNSTSDNE